MESEEIREKNQFEGLIQGLIDSQYGSCDDFILPLDIAGLRDNIQRLLTSGKMKSSGIGNKLDFQQNKGIRGDKINWIGDDSSDQYEQIYLQKISRLIAYLNTTCFTAITSFESHYSSYEIGSFYKRHLDQFKSEKGRKFSMVLYLNEDWKDEDGGKLSLYPKGSNQMDIAPIGGRMILFRSDEMEHEVNASFTRERRSIAGWMKG